MRAWQITKLGEIEQKVSILQALRPTTLGRRTSAHCRQTISAARHPRQPLAIFAKLHLQPFDLGSQESVFLGGRVGGFLQLIYLGLQILQVLLLTLPESPLSSTILGLALLYAILVSVDYEAINLKKERSAYRSGLRCQRLPTRLLSLALSSFLASFFGIRL